jgi:hypothetical protein
MTTIEDRLRDAFTALDAQVVVPPMAEPTSRRLPVAWLATVWYAAHLAWARIASMPSMRGEA